MYTYIHTGKRNIPKVRSRWKNNVTSQRASKYPVLVEEEAVVYIYIPIYSPCYVIFRM
jgi:hypothetical protein